ncbi:MAG: AraC family transcriptional regulator [Chthoniobacteraceae bacterium]
MKTTPTTENLRRLIRDVPLASNLFHGLLCQQSLAPDNIIFYRRGEKPLSKAEGVSNNYHHRFEFVIVAGAPGPVRIDQTSYLLQPGECALIFPNQFHHYLDLADEGADWLFLTFDIRNSAAIQSLRDTPRALDQEALELVQKLVRDYLQPVGVAPDTLSISYHLSRLLLHLLECPALPQDRRDIHSGTTARDVILEKINHYIREHLSQSVTISDIANELGYSVSHLRAVFRDRLGVSLGRYMRESRLSEAAQLLQSSELNVSAIGERCGFESLYAFSRAFRKAYGIPPRAYRQLVVEGTTPPSRRQLATTPAA